MPAKPPVKLRLEPHETALKEAGALRDITHANASALWLTAPSSDIDAIDALRAAADVDPLPPLTLVYRPMGDQELRHLMQFGVLPSTQPYQAVMEGCAGRTYAEKYLNGKKWVDTSPTAVVEFVVPAALVARLMAIQQKAEDGCVSMGLGHKAGRGLPLFNAWLDECNTAARSDGPWCVALGQAGGVAASFGWSHFPGAAWRVVHTKRGPR